jgi:uncharacterized protein (TIGR02246 family)
MMTKPSSGTARNRAVLRTALALAGAGFAGNAGSGASTLLARETCGVERSSASRAADELAVRSLVATASEAWRRGDAVGAAAMWAEDGELVAGDGSYHVGRSQITAYLTGLLSGAWKGSRFVAEVSSVRFLGPDLALLHLNSAFIKAGESEPAPENRAAQSMLAVREGSGLWRVALYHSTRVHPPSPPTSN